MKPHEHPLRRLPGAIERVEETIHTLRGLLEEYARACKASRYILRMGNAALAELHEAYFQYNAYWTWRFHFGPYLLAAEFPPIRKGPRPPGKVPPRAWFRAGILPGVQAADEHNFARRAEDAMQASLAEEPESYQAGGQKIPVFGASPPKEPEKREKTTSAKRPKKKRPKKKPPQA